MKSFSSSEASFGSDLPRRVRPSDAVEGRRGALEDVALESRASRVSARLPRRVPRAMDAMGSDASNEPDVIRRRARVDDDDDDDDANDGARDDARARRAVRRDATRGR